MTQRRAASSLQGLGDGEHLRELRLDPPETVERPAHPREAAERRHEPEVRRIEAAEPFVEPAAERPEQAELVEPAVALR